MVGRNESDWSIFSGWLTGLLVRMTNMACQFKKHTQLRDVLFGKQHFKCLSSKIFCLTRDSYLN